jgi:hypothetical protein
MLKLLSSLLFIFFCLSATAQKNIYPDKVLICYDGDPLPQDSRHMGELNVGNNHTSYDYRRAVEQAKIKTAKKGGNIFRIDNTANFYMDLTKTGICFKGTIYYASNIDVYLAYRDGSDTVSKKLISDTASYALVYIYQPANREGITRSFDLKIGSETYQIKEDSSYCIKLRTKGSTLVSQNNGKKGTPERAMDIHFGKAYFIKCDVLSRGLGYYYALSVAQPNAAYNDLKEITKHE